LPYQRVKTDARDAAHLARLLHLGQIVEVAVPSVEQEAARDLVRAREDCRGGLMSARHRVSKLFLRQGIIYSGGRTWTGKHEAWLRAQRFEVMPLQLAYDTALDTMLATVDRRDRLDGVIAELAADSVYTPVVTVGGERGVDRHREPTRKESGSRLITIDGHTVFGPVLTSVPPVDETSAIFEAVVTLVRTSEFTQLERPRAHA
jgi:hypothetical protein